MAARGMMRGHPVHYDEAAGVWRWSDTGDPVGTPPVRRACACCGLPPTPEGHDACLGALPGVTAACCGHGVVRGRALCYDGRVLPLDGPHTRRANARRMRALATGRPARARDVGRAVGRMAAAVTLAWCAFLAYEGLRAVLAIAAGHLP